MREILFRGKTQEHTRWIYGDLNHYMCDDGVFIAENGHSMHRVLKETVGQYTGLTDKNGKKIFEGDIVKNQYDKNKYQYFKIFYCNRTYCWRVKNKYAMSGNLCNVIGDIEVIGNIHDNPELLKGGDENA